MAKFQFRMETLLKLREKTRDERRAELAQAYEAEQIIQQQIEQVAIEFEGVGKRVRVASQPGAVKTDELLNLHRYRLLLTAQRQQYEEQQKQINEEIERRRESLVEADQQVQILEKLRERQRTEHQNKETQREVKEMDEIALLRVARHSD